MVEGERATSATSVEVRLPANRSQLFVLRSLVATIALREDFDLDEVDDVKLAVDEMCSVLVTRAGAAGMLCCQFESSPGAVSVVATVGTDNNSPIAQDTFGWRVLATLADDVTTWNTPGHLHIRMTRSRSGATNW
jgi:serine/threonine-protein kinase RsbW